jgi:hypothetical protein
MVKEIYKVKKNLTLLLILLASHNHLTAQVSVTGSVCIIPGITYQYIINCNQGSSPVLGVCTTGGTLSAGGRCTPSGTSLNAVFVVWKDTSFHKLEVTSSSGNISLIVQGTTDIRGGQLQDSDKVQLYNSTVASYTFRCEAAGGGSCSPDYLYQWQKSEDGLNWINLSGATAKDLQFSGSIIVNTFFRRVTTETNSSTVGYSNRGMLVVPF